MVPSFFGVAFVSSFTYTWSLNLTHMHVEVLILQPRLHTHLPAIETPSRGIKALTTLHSRLYHPRSSKGRKEEAWPRQGTQDAHLGQALSILLMYITLYLLRHLHIYLAEVKCMYVVYLSTRGRGMTCSVYLAGTVCPRVCVTAMFDPSPSR